MIVAIIAVVLSLAGTAYAGIQIGRNSIGSFQLRDGAVTTAKLRNGAVTAAKLKGCPSNSIEIGPGCVENGLRPAAGYSAAVATCASIGGRLPFVSELAAIAALGKPLGNPELAGDRITQGRSEQLIVYADPKVTATEPIETARRFRCVTSPA